MRRAGAVLLSTAFVLAGLAVAPERAAAVPPAPTDVGFTVDATGTRAELTWSQPAGEAAAEHRITLHDVTGGANTQVGMFARCFDECTNYTFTGLVHGRSYTGKVRALGEDGAEGPVATAPGAHLADQSGCTSTGVEACVTVDATNAVAPMTHNAAGFQAAHDAPLQYADLVHPTWWRYGWNPNNPNQSDDVPEKAARYGASVINVLSTGWFETTKAANNGNAAAPWWNDYTGWETYVRNQVIDLRARGLLPDYWEVWNEPGGNVPPLGPEQTNFNHDRQLELYRRTYNVIKSEEPTAKIAAYATVSFMGHEAARDAQGLPLQVSLDELLPFLQEHDLGLDLLTWHEIRKRNFYDTNYYADLNLERHVETARAMLVEHGFANVPIHLDEYLEASVHHLPAWTLGTIAAIERTGVLGGVRTCWPNIPNPVPVIWKPLVNGCVGDQMMDNLLTGYDPGLLGGGGHPSQPRPVLWVYDAYRQMTGNRVASTSSFDRVVHLAARDGNRIAVMIGRRETSNPAGDNTIPSDNPNEPAAPPPAPQTVYVDVGTGGTYNVTATRFTNAYNGAQLAPAPMAMVPTQVTSVGGRLTIPIPGIADGVVVHLVITPA